MSPEGIQEPRRCSKDEARFVRPTAVNEAFGSKGETKLGRLSID